MNTIILFYTKKPSNLFYIHILRLVIFCFLIIFFNQPLHAQNNILNQPFQFKSRNLNVQEALNEITVQTGFYFIYNSAFVEKDKKIKISKNNQTLQQSLNEIFNDTTLNFKIIEKYIVVSKKRNTATQEETGENFLYIKGKIIDSENSEPLPFAAIGLENQNKGTIANSAGEFILKIPKTLTNSIFTITHLGYQTLKIPVSQISQTYSVFPLKREIISLQEIIIRNPEPINLLRNAIAAIPKNYPGEPSLMTAFYREATRENKGYLIISEAVLKVYKSSYISGFDINQVKVVKSRKVENKELFDTLVVKLKAGLSSCMLLDIIKNQPEFIDENEISNYKYTLTDIVKYDDQLAYVIYFEQENFVTEPKFCGTIYIDYQNNAILGAAFEINPKYVESMKDEFITKNKGKFAIKPLKIAYKVTYKKINDKYYQSHVRGDLQFKVRKKNTLFAKNYSLFFEMVTSDIETENVKKIPRNEVYDGYSVFAETINGYDENFWGEENIIQPETPLEEAFRKFSNKIK